MITTHRGLLSRIVAGSIGAVLLLATMAPVARAEADDDTAAASTSFTSHLPVAVASEGSERSAVSSGYSPQDLSDPKKKASAESHLQMLKQTQKHHIMTTQGLVPSSKVLSKITVAGQPNSYYCGPATLISLSRGRDVWLTWEQAAKMLGTTTQGTDWYNGTYPMADALNAAIPGWNYAPVGFGVATPEVIATYKQNLVWAITNGWGIAGDAWETPEYSQYYLEGHPRGVEHYHWFAIRGYSGSFGERTNYVDSAFTLWETVPQEAWQPSDQIAHAMGGRGYVW